MHDDTLDGIGERAREFGALMSGPPSAGGGGRVVRGDGKA